MRGLKNISGVSLSETLQALYIARNILTKDFLHVMDNYPHLIKRIDLDIKKVREEDAATNLDTFI